MDHMKRPFRNPQSDSSRRENALISTITLPAHPEGFQIDPITGRVFVNVPDTGVIAVSDPGTHGQAAAWKVAGVGANFPMALDSERGVLASVFRHPPNLVLLDATTGTVMAKLPACRDADDVFFDPQRERIYVSCGAGEITIFQREGVYNALASVRTSSGAWTSLFVPEVDRLFVAERAEPLRSNAAIAVYRPMPLTNSDPNNAARFGSVCM